VDRRPDGTPVPGQFGLASAAPLMLQVHDLLSNRDSQRGISAPVLPVPANVGVAAICWPLGQPMNRRIPIAGASALPGPWTTPRRRPCRPGSALGLGLMESVGQRQGLRSMPIARAPGRDIRCGPRRWSPGCPGPNAAARCRPSTPIARRRAGRRASPPLSIVGVREGDQLRLPAGSQQPCA
jgi:penicillin-binding protein 1C